LGFFEKMGFSQHCLEGYLARQGLQRAPKKRSYVTASSDPGLHRIQCCTVLHRDEIMSSVSNPSRIFVCLLMRCACIRA